MKFITVNTYDKLSRQAANIISAQVILKPDSVLGLATGSSPLGTYKQLIEWYGKGDIDFSKVTSVNLDEYVGLDGTNEQSYRYFMNKNFFEHINIDISNTFVPNGCASLLLANGVPLKQIQEWLGHSDFSTTANIYAHLDYTSKLSSAQAMESGIILPTNDRFGSKWEDKNKDDVIAK